MTQTSHLKSAGITNLDTIPPFTPSVGAGASGFLRQVDGFSVPLAADATGSTYQLVRVPSFAIIKAVVFESEAQGAGKFSLSVYYSDSTVDGTPVANQGLIVGGSPGGVAFFAADIDCASAVLPTNETNQNSVYTLNLRDQPLWQALGLAADPGGFFDIVAVCHTTAVTTGTGRLGIKVDYIV